MSRLDTIYRRLLITRFFDKGWGKPENLQKLFEFRKIVSNREECIKRIPKDYPVEITKDEQTSDCRILEGKFLTPLELYLPGLVPKEAQDAHFQMLLPNKWKDEDYKPVCLHLAGTGDHYYWRRRNFIAKPLLRDAGIGAILLENPFYGVRKPKNQVRSCLENVSDIFVMGGCLVLESLVLFNWCERNGLGPLGITGLSMGGHMASLAATNWPKPLVLVPCLSWSTASSVFTEGVMSQSINWDHLEMQFFADGNYRERLAKMVTVVDDSFVAGQKFIKQFNESMRELKSDINETKINQLNDTCGGEPSSNIIEVRNDSALKNELLSKEAAEFTPLEITKINEKIREILDKQERERELEKNKKKIKSDVSTLEVASNVLSSATHGITSIFESGKTKLMGLILPVTASNVSITTNEDKEIIKTVGTVANHEAKTLEKPTLPKNGEKIDITKTQWWSRETLQFMRGVMDECTHLKNFSVPYDTSLIIVVCAKDDAYVPRKGCTSLEDVWPGSEVRYLDAGHVSAYVLHQKLFRSCIKEAFERSKKKWIPYHRQTIGEKAEITYLKLKKDDEKSPTTTTSKISNNEKQ